MVTTIRKSEVKKNIKQFILTTKSVDQVSSSRNLNNRSTNQDVNPRRDGYALSVQISGTWSKNNEFSKTSMSDVIVSSPWNVDTCLSVYFLLYVMFLRNFIRSRTFNFLETSLKMCVQIFKIISNVKPNSNRWLMPIEQVTQV